MFSVSLHGYYQVWSQNQQDAGNSEFRSLLSYNNWRLSWYAFMDLLDVEPNAEFICSVCGPIPDIVVCDATSLGFQRKFASQVFKPQRNEGPVVKRTS